MKSSRHQIQNTIIGTVLVSSLTLNLALASVIPDFKKRLDAATSELNSVASSCDKHIEHAQWLQEENDRMHKIISAYGQDFVVNDPTPPCYFDVALDEEMQSYIWTLCGEFGITEHYGLVYALIQTESSFRPDLVSSTNDYGLMQINVVNHKNLSNLFGIDDFLDPYQNVHGGIYLLSRLLHKYDVSDALMAYNMGEGGASKLWRRGIHSSKYSEKVLSYYKEYIIE